MRFNRVFRQHYYLRRVFENGVNRRTMQHRRNFNTFIKLSKSEELFIIKKAEKYTNYVKEGYEFKVGVWLNICSLLILVMISIGGYTRLTESGLSITHWKFQGIKYPRNDEEWLKEFEKYKSTPEYKEVHYNISLDEYKKIFFNEWLHRMFGRAIGLFFVSGSALFLYKKCLKKNMLKNLSVLFALGTFQGFVGWWMVKSGFEKLQTENKTPRVSPYRLVFHLFCATVMYSYLFLNSLTLIEIGKLRRQFSKSQITKWPEFLRNELMHEMYEKRNVTKKMKLGLFAFAFLVLSNILYGGFVAGNDAGYAYNTWPKMLDKYIPDEVANFYMNKKKKYEQLFENTGIVQFNHRMLAYFIVLSSFLLHYYSKQMALSRKTKLLFFALPFITTVQMLTGINLLVHHVPIHMALVHQFGGFCILSTLLHLIKRTCR
ncbi:cytochrome c oxidase assembly protein COX15, putative [Plasmodium malariae]|uniref:Cytochrome c oxidase assembly protein COX15, putative n=1 Tax=Plasmodium malariae TaxID=5858 RepID=A0A1A8W976_PLAMA|nr:cytochrome c oxidase assembly protein COX15, putative [Plasmodium malariae]SBS89375.1 cytochrome c oxidase assembly protein, putative [Plasmodium malariae]SCP02606.1 cytochrome c oxidase assembly protein COX15, putative [Plasmodium malariae]